MIVADENKIDALDSWPLHESEIQVQGNQRFFFSSSRLVFAASAIRSIGQFKKEINRALKTSINITEDF